MSIETLELRKYIADTYRCAVSSNEFAGNQDGTDLYLIINGLYVVSARPFDNYPPGCIYLNDKQRTW